MFLEANMPDSIKPKASIDETQSFKLPEEPEGPPSIIPESLVLDALNLDPEVLKINPDGFDFEPMSDFNVDFADLNIEVWSPDMPDVSPIDDLAQGVFNPEALDLELISYENIIEFIGKDEELDLMEFEIELAEKAFGINLDDFENDQVDFKNADFILLPNNVLVVRSSKHDELHLHKERISQHCDIPFEKLKIIVLSDEEWSLFVGKLVRVLDRLDKIANIKSEGETTEDKKEVKSRKAEFKSIRKPDVSSGNEKDETKGDFFVEAQALHDETIKMEIQREFNKKAREKEREKERDRVESQERKREIEKEGIKKREIDTKELKIIRERKSKSEGKKP